MAANILRHKEQDSSTEWQSLNQYIESYAIEADEASSEELKKLDREDEELLEEFFKKRRHLEWEIEDDCRRLRESES
ncbi:hypothetical protein STRDD11_01772 [Streptococcus sp. DD11]|uniref:hypothetical protein n=1 Tax=Streptococcus sp. DD11 TaxID=1777879 RepID=UPI0007952EF3|nr:hypothetical protein [Streptococcus sp. DD11]KXT82699.1 hypothetical protein STRDD11_01772 [Streptococcus sp. DD11]